MNAKGKLPFIVKQTDKVWHSPCLDWVRITYPHISPLDYDGVTEVKVYVANSSRENTHGKTLIFLKSKQKIFKKERIDFVGFSLWLLAGILGVLVCVQYMCVFVWCLWSLCVSAWFVCLRSFQIWNAKKLFLSKGGTSFQTSCFNFRVCL